MDTIPQDTPQKQCSKCKQIFPATPIYFHRDPTKKDGFRCHCKKCIGCKTLGIEPQEKREGQKQCTKCKEFFPATEQFFYRQKYRNGYGIGSRCKECYKTNVNRYPVLITLTCETCSKEFQRGKAHHEYQMKTYKRQHVYCSNACNTTLTREWPETIADEYLQGATMNGLAKKYGFTASGVRIHLHEMGIETGFTQAVRKRMSEIGKERFKDPEEQEKQRQHCYRRMYEGTLSFSSKLEDRVAIELSRRGIVFARQYFMSTPGIQGFFACVDFLLADGRVIEVNGTYWHADPRKYPDGPISISQRQATENDKRKRQKFAELHIPLIELWEMDLEADMVGTLDKALQ